MSKNIKEHIISEVGKLISKDYEDVWVGVQIWHGDSDKIYFKFTKSKEEIIKVIDNWRIQCEETIEETYTITDFSYPYEFSLVIDEYEKVWWEAWNDVGDPIVSIEAHKIKFD